MTSDEVASPTVDEPKAPKSAQQSDVIEDGDYTHFVRMSNGAELPITYGSWRGACLHQWYEPDRVFNRIFYAALKAVGVENAVGNHDLSVLARYRQALALSPAQVRGAYGLEKGVFDNTGRFRAGVESDSDWDREILEARKKSGDKQCLPGPLGDDPDDWRRIEADASAACLHKPDMADIDTEFRWIRSHLAEWPDFKGAPSRGAIKDWCEINRPGNEALKRDFLKLAWTRRLTPGDRRPTKPSVFEEDAVDDVALAEYEDGLEDRLSQYTENLGKEPASDTAEEPTRTAKTGQFDGQTL